MIVKPIKIFALLGLAVVWFIICYNIYQESTNPYVDYTCRVYHIDGRIEIKHLMQKYPPRQPQAFRPQEKWISGFDDPSIYKFEIIKTDTIQNHDRKRSY